MPRNVFVSYGRADAEIARHVEVVLRRLPHVRVWSDQSLSAGEAWGEALREMLAQSQVVVIILTPTALESKWVMHELGAAWALGKPIVLLGDSRLAQALPVDLGSTRVLALDEVDRLGDVIEQEAA